MWENAFVFFPPSQEKVLLFEEYLSEGFSFSTKLFQVSLLVRAICLPKEVKGVSQFCRGSQSTLYCKVGKDAFFKAHSCKDCASGQKFLTNYLLKPALFGSVEMASGHLKTNRMSK